MADFSALKTSIQNYIKQNGNEEITGNLLQQILLSMVTTLGDSAINDLVTALNAEIANRGNADTTLQGNINSEAAARGNADTELGGRITTLQGVVNGIIANIENGYVYAGIATPSTTPASGKVFYLALTAGTYTNFGATVVPQGINILKYNGSAWSLDSFLGLDDAPTQGSDNLVKSGGVLDSIIKDGSAFDLSAYNNGATYADLSAALTDLNALPAAYKKGGMSIKFVQSSDNKYVQYFLTKDEWSTTGSDWEKINLEEEVNQLDVQIYGTNIETPITANYSNGYIFNDGTISGTSSPTYQHTDAIRLTDDMVSLKCLALLSNTLAGGVGFYKTSELPISGAQAQDRTVEVVGINTGSNQDNNEVLNISAEKIADLKSRGAEYFSVCVLTSGQSKGISYFTPQRGIVDNIQELQSDVNQLEEQVDHVINGVIVETQVADSEFEYGYITDEGKFPAAGTSTTFSRTSPSLIGDIIGIRAKIMANSMYGGGVFFFKSSNKPTVANEDLVGVIGMNSTSTVGYVNDEITVTKEQIRQMQALGAEYYAISSYTDGRALYTSVVTEEGLKQIQEKVENLEQVTQTCRKRMDITLQDTPDEILTKLLKVYDGKDYDVYWENGSYDLSNAWLTMSTMRRFIEIGTYELPIGGINNEYFFNGSTIRASGLYDLVGEQIAGNSNLFGTLRLGNHSYVLHDATFIISDGNYAFHDETSSTLGTQRHIYDNIKFINEATEHSTWIHTGFSFGSSYNVTLILRNCYFNNTDGAPCVRNHGMNRPVEGEISKSRYILCNNYFATEVEFGYLAIGENVDFVFCGNSYTTLTISNSGQGTYTKYIYCNEQRT